MRQVGKAAVVIGTFAISFAAIAQTAPSTASVTAELPRLKTLFVRPGSEFYSSDLVGNGVHGQALVQILVAPDGTVSNAHLKESSGSGELDASALKLTSSLKLKAKEAVAPEEIIVPIVFSRDSAATLSKKTCAEFNQDYSYFTQAFPNKDPTDMRIFDMAAGLLVATRGPDMAMIRKLNQAGKNTITSCAKTPNSKFMDLYSKNAR